MKKATMKKNAIPMLFCGLIFLMLLEFSACSYKERLPYTTYEIQGQCRKINTGPGPEDFVLDQWHRRTRLLISCCERRDPAINGDIYFYEPATGKTGIMPRTKEPKRLAAFKPHGMDIRHAPGGTYLYVILHDPYATGERLENAVGIYRVIDDQLEMLHFLEDSEHLWSPNDLSVLESGDFYVTNDYRGKLDLYLKRKASEIAFYDSHTGNWQIVADGLAFANGILAEPERVFVTTTLGNRVLYYPRNEDGTLGRGQLIMELKGGDNLTRYGKHLIAAAHFDDFAFLRHAKDSEKKSPAVVVRITPGTNMRKAIFVDTGEFISAASTALIQDGKIYISQVFDPFLVVCDVPPDINW